MFTGVPAARVLQAPAQVGQVNAIHGVQHIQTIGDKKVNFLLGMLGPQAIHQVQLGADGPLCAGRGGLHLAYDLAG